jgi:hypothetical protein
MNRWWRDERLCPDKSAAVLTEKIRRRERFFYLRYGDGALECMNRVTGQTCDGETYSPELGGELRRAWEVAVRGREVYIGDWLSASFDPQTHWTRYDEFYLASLGNALPKMLHFEALLLMRTSTALVDFYRSVKEDSRRKLFMGPAGNAGAAAMLGAEFLETPMGDLRIHALTESLAARTFDVLLYGAGMAGNIPVVRCWERWPERTYVHLGSAMDPLFRGRTRSQQIAPEEARTLFKDLL